MERALAQGIICGALVAALLIAWIFATGQTFGQRCAKMYPNADRLTIGRCVYDLSHDKRP